VVTDAQFPSYESICDHSFGVGWQFDVFVSVWWYQLACTRPKLLLLLLLLSLLLPPPKFLPLSVCLSVCQFVRQITQKAMTGFWWFYWMRGAWPKEQWIQCAAKKFPRKFFSILLATARNFYIFTWNFTPLLLIHNRIKLLSSIVLFLIITKLLNFLGDHVVISDVPGMLTERRMHHIL